MNRRIRNLTYGGVGGGANNPAYLMVKGCESSMPCGVERKGRDHSGEVETVMEFDLERAFEWSR